MGFTDMKIPEEEIEYWVNWLKEDVEGLREKANTTRQKNYAEEISVSLNVFLPVTRQCRNVCRYCGFSRERNERWLLREHGLHILREGKKARCLEALFVSGDAPEKKLRSARKFLKRHGASNLIEYTIPFLDDALRNGLLPHVNLGVLNTDEYKVLRPFTASMGLMLESTSKELLRKGRAHYQCPDKVPERRIKSIREALRMHIPFTSGLLIGIGESPRDRVESALVLQRLAKQEGFLQEVIVQPFTPIPYTPMRNYPPASFFETMSIVALLRVLLPSDVSIQVPPNLVNLNDVPKLLEWGVNDLGGISPLTRDHVNPLSPWPQLQELVNILESSGHELMIRLPVYPKYLNFVGEKAKVLLDEKYAEFKQSGMLPWKQVLLP